MVKSKKIKNDMYKLYKSLKNKYQNYILNNKVMKVC